MSEFRFPKEERLKSKKTLSRLFKEGRSFNAFPVRAVWLQMEEAKSSSLQFTVSVPKRKFKHAVDRNRIKRQIREAYRLHKSELTELLSTAYNNKPTFALMLIYVSRDKESYQTIQKGVKKSINRLMRDMSKLDQNDVDK